MDLGLGFDTEPFPADFGIDDWSSTVAQGNFNPILAPTLDDISLQLFDSDEIDPTHFLLKISSQKEASLKRAAEIEALEAKVSDAKARAEAGQRLLELKNNELLSLEYHIATAKHELRSLTDTNASLNHKKMALRSQLHILEKELMPTPEPAPSIQFPSLTAPSSHSPSTIADLLMLSCSVDNVPTLEDVLDAAGECQRTSKSDDVSIVHEVIAHLILIKSTPSSAPQLPSSGEVASIRDSLQMMDIHMAHYEELLEAPDRVPTCKADDLAKIRAALHSMLGSQ